MGRSLVLPPRGQPDAGPWVRAHAAAVLDGHAGDAASAIRAAQRRRPAQTAKAKAAAAVAGYLDAKAPYLDYPTALAEGRPILTGVIEGTCRHLVKDRMDITGARWGTATAEAILQLRALHANGDLDEYWKYHLQQEQHRNHPARYNLAALPLTPKEPHPWTTEHIKHVRRRTDSPGQRRTPSGATPRPNCLVYPSCAAGWQMSRYIDASGFTKAMISALPEILS